MTLKKELEEKIKDQIGARGDAAVSEILRIVEEEVYDISRHVLEAWQDKPLSTFWNRIGGSIDTIAAKIEKQFGHKNTEEQIK